MRLAIALTALLFAAPALAAEDDAVAYRLFSEGKFAEAAEIFTDPAWKGVALYKSDQYWRAAEAFVRAGDPRSAYNLGNSYARLGYFELALDSYLRALSLDPGLADAAFNADLMREALARRDDQGQQGIQPQAREIDRVEAPRDKDGNSSDDDGESGAADERNNTGSDGQTNQTEAPPEKSGSDGGDGLGGDPRTDDTAADANNVRGEAGERSEMDAGSGGSEATGSDEATAQAAGMRAKLETEQATEQWLNRIADTPADFLKARIALEARRRAAAGAAVATEADAW